MMMPAACEEAIRDTLPGFPFREVDAEHHGWSFWTFVVNGEWIFRFPRTEADARLLEREFAILPGLASHLPVSVPNYEYQGEWEGRPFGAYRQIDGEPIEAPRAQGNTELARQVGELLTALHSFPTDSAATSWNETDPPTRWLKQQRAFQAECAERAFPLLTPRDRIVASDLFNRFNSGLCDEGAGCALAHCDLGLAHLLRRDGELRGVIDWSDAAIGDPAIDFAGILAGTSMTWLRLVLEYYDGTTGDRFIERVRYYHAVAPLHDVLYGISVNDRGIIRAGARGFATRTH
jgi:aminoglycoside 2''-phosphotransferase